jgi:4,5-DOPA dioxygenase extradiol
MKDRMPAVETSEYAFTSLQASVKMPVLFLGHGSPMNAIEDNAYKRSWEALGSEFGHKWPKPQLIVCVSAHWLTEGWYLTGMDKPKTIHDFGGFPQALFDQQYPAPGAPRAAQEISQLIRQPRTGQPLGLDLDSWGLDHGAWSVLKPMFPQADIPVIQLSMDYSRPMNEHLAIGQQLKALRHWGVLIVCSGNVVHNLRSLQPGASPHQAYEWATAFDQTITRQLESGQPQEVQNFQSLGAVAQQSHPSYEHFLPMLYAVGAVDADEKPVFFNTDFVMASIAMRSVIWG